MLREKDRKLRKINNEASECLLTELPNGREGLDWIPIRNSLVLVLVEEFSDGPFSKPTSFWSLVGYKKKYIRI